MKKGFTFLFLIAVLASTYYGLKNHFGMVSALPQKVEEGTVQKRLSASHPILEDQMIVALVVADNDADVIERSLGSLLKQSYPHMRILFVDNGSTDGTFEKAKAFAGETQKTIEWVRYETKKRRMEVYFETIGKCAPHEVIALVEGKDWLSHENVFDHLNCVYANPEVWMTYSRAISHPDYQHVEGKLFGDAPFREKAFRKDMREELTSLITFYAGFFQEIKLQDLLFQGKFIDEKVALTLQLPLTEMGGEHILFLDEVSYVKNLEREKVDHQLHLREVAAIDAHLRSLPKYPTHSQLRLALNTPTLHRYKSDLVIFSEDSPLQLYACLESLFTHGRDINDVYVLYRVSDQEFQRAYLNLQGEFHTVEFLNVCDYPGNDYGTLLTKVLSNRLHASPYALLGTDTFIFDERTFFHDSIAAMEKVHADHFFFNIEAGDTLPPTIPIESGIYAYQLGEKGATHPFTLALCRKSLFEGMGEVADFGTFEKLWKKTLRPEAVALTYDAKKTTPLKMEQEASHSQKKEWNMKFIEGYKIDLPSLSCEMEEVSKGELPLIKREKHWR